MEVVPLRTTPIIKKSGNTLIEEVNPYTWRLSNTYLKFLKIFTSVWLFCNLDNYNILFISSHTVMIDSLSNVGYDGNDSISFENFSLFSNFNPNGS